MGGVYTTTAQEAEINWKMLWGPSLFWKGWRAGSGDRKSMTDTRPGIREMTVGRVQLMSPTPGLGLSRDSDMANQSIYIPPGSLTGHGWTQ